MFSLPASDDCSFQDSLVPKVVSRSQSLATRDYAARIIHYTVYTHGLQMLK